MPGGVGGGCREASPYPDPAREGGEPILLIARRPEGPAQIVSHLRRSGNQFRISLPALTGRAINRRSFGPKNSIGPVTANPSIG